MKIRYFAPATFFVAASAFAQTQPLTCQLIGGVTPVIRAGGLTELVNDAVFDCSGGTPTAVGELVPTINLSLAVTASSLDGTAAGPARLSSNPTSGLFSEALLFIDEPNTNLHSTTPILNCGQTGAPDNGSNGAGICAIRSTGVPSQTYDGTPNGYGAATCDGTSGRPVANTFGCGRPNIFQGRLTSLTSPFPQLQFLGVPFDPPGTNQHRYLHVTNLRVNVAGVTLSPTYGHAVVLLSANIAGSVPVALQAQSNIIGYVSPSLTNPVIETAVSSPIVVGEGFESVFRERNYALKTGDHNGTPGNGTVQAGMYIYGGSANYPVDIAQNWLGQQTLTEGGYLWPNNGVNRPWTPNPPPGIGFGAITPLGGPLASVSFGGTNTGIDKSGLAQAGTRVAINFTNIPNGATVELPPTIVLKRVVGQATTGILALTSSDANGAGAYSPRSGFFNATDHIAVYEVLFADPYSLEQASIPFSLTGAPAGTQLKAIVQLAPFYSTLDSGRPSADLPEPRFADSSKLVPCLNLPCLTVAPNTGFNLRPATFAVSIDQLISTNAAPAAVVPSILTGAQVKLVKAGLPDIDGTGETSSSDQQVLTIQANLAGAPVGPRDVVLTTSGGRTITIPDGFTVETIPGCSYAVSPTNVNAKFSADRADLTVTAPAGCTWAASTDVSWISLAQSKSDTQSAKISPNTHGPARTGHISIAGTVVTFQQAEH